MISPAPPARSGASLVRRQVRVHTVRGAAHVKVGYGMVLGMATKKITITLEEDQLASIRNLVASGKAATVSAFVKHAVAVSLADVSGWGAMLGLALQRTGGPLTRKERAWADSVLRPSHKSRRKRTAA